MTQHEPTEEEVATIREMLKEKQRLRTLSNEDLVRDYLKTHDADAILHVEEMATRLWPDWHKQTGGEDL